MTREDILDIRRRAFEEAAELADAAAERNRASAIKLHQRAARQAQLYDEDVADQTKISAQVLDACAEEARVIAHHIRSRKLPK